MSEQDAFRYAAFISYSHRDEKHAAWLHRALETFKAPADIEIPNSLPHRDRRLSPVFRDREELSSSHDLSESIQEALASSNALIVICSPAAAASRWVNEEIKTFKRLHGEERVFALIVEGDDNGPEPFFPEALLQKIGPDGEILDERGEPLAADLRPGKDGKGHAKLKVAAGLLDVGLDSLAQRDAARERKQMMRITGFAVVGMTVFAAVAIWAFFAQNEANKQKKIAEREAMTATRTAEFMVDLFYISHPGESRGQEITAKQILSEGVEQIESGLDGEPNVQARLMHTMGEAYTGLGLYGEAVSLLEKTRDRRVEANADHLDTFRTQNALARALFENVDFSAARGAYDELIKIAEERLEAGEWNSVYADAFAGLAELEFRSDNYEVAQSNFQRSIDLFEQREDTDNIHYINALSGLASTVLYQDQFDEAENLFKRAEILAQKKLGDDHYKTSEISNNLAHVYYFRGDIPMAANTMERSYLVTEKLLGIDHPETSISANNLSRLKYEAGDMSDSYKYLSAAIEVERAAGRNNHFEFGYFVNTMGLLQMERREFDEGLKLFNEAAELISDPENPVFATIRINLGRAHCEVGKVDEGLGLITRGRTALSSVYGDSGWPYGVANEFEARCLLKQGDVAEAKELATKAYEMLLQVSGEDHHFTKRAKHFLESTDS